VIPETGSSRQLKSLFVTDRGWSWVDSGEPLPEYAEGYLAVIRSSVPAPDSVIEQYLKEALATYDQRSFFSSSVMLGAASERLAYLLLDAIKGWVAVPEPDSVRRIDNVLHRDRSLVKLLEEIDRYLRKAKNFKPSPPDEAAEIHLLSIQDSIRRQRNDAVHPIVGEVNSDALRLALQAFPGVYRKAYELMQWFNEKHATSKTLP
jgi:hypothetical protein